MLTPSWQSSFFYKLSISTILSTFFQCILLSHPVSAGITAFDAITSLKKPVRLQALTKGRFFSEGGKLVEFHIDDKHIGTTLSGGDGFAYLRFQPESKGLKKINVKAGNDSDKAYLLVTAKNEKVILIAIEGSLFESAISFKPAKGAKETIHEISKDFSIIYLTSIIGVKQSRQWLRENNFFESVVFSWSEEVLTNDLKDKGIQLYAVIGNPEMLDEISDIKKFSFKEAEGIEVVESWAELLKKL